MFHKGLVIAVPPGHLTAHKVVHGPTLNCIWEQGAEWRSLLRTTNAPCQTSQARACLQARCMVSELYDPITGSLTRTQALTSEAECRCWQQSQPSCSGWRSAPSAPQPPRCPCCCGRAWRGQQLPRGIPHGGRGLLPWEGPWTSPPTCTRPPGQSRQLCGTCLQYRAQSRAQPVKGCGSSATRAVMTWQMPLPEWTTTWGLPSSSEVGMRTPCPPAGG